MENMINFASLTKQFKNQKKIEYKTLSLRVEKQKAQEFEATCKEIGTYTSNALDTFITQYLIWHKSLKQQNNLIKDINIIIQYEISYGLLTDNFSILSIENNIEYKGIKFEYLFKISDDDVQKGYSPIKYWGFNANQITKFFHEFEIPPLLKKLYEKANINPRGNK